MKKLFVITVFLFSLMLILPAVNAADQEDSFTGIGIWADNNSSELEGHIDMLVPRSDFEDKINTNVNSEFISIYSDYQTFDYLANTEWISYCAYVEGATCYIEDYGDFYVFADSTRELLSLDEIKFIYVDDTGNTVTESDIINVPNAFFSFAYSRLHYYDVDNQEFDIDMSIRLDGIFILVILFILFISFIFTLYRLLIARLLKLEFEKKTFVGIYYFLIHIALFVVGFFILNYIEFIQLLVDDIIGLILFLVILFSIETILSYYLRYKYLDKGKYIIVSLITYVSILLFFLVF